MSGVVFRANKGAIAYAGSSVKTTMVQVTAASNHRVKVKEIEVTFNGDGTAEAGVLIEVERQTADGTATTLTLVKENSADDETLEASAKHTYTVQPTSGDLLHASYCHPTGGRNWKFNFGDEIQIPGGGSFGVAVTGPDAHSVSVSIRCEE